jgi:hypothetical protein
MVVVKSRLHPFALPPPEIALAEKKALAEGGNKRAFEQGRLLKVVGLDDQDLVNEGGSLMRILGRYSGPCMVRTSP